VGRAFAFERAALEPVAALPGGPPEGTGWGSAG
jgi:hypothetical protein